MRILLTGTTGFIGSNLSRYYSQQDHEIIEYRRGSDLAEILRSERPDVIINCAGEIYDESKMIESNIIMVQTMLEYVKDNPKSEMIHLGSSSEYGKINYPSSEEDPIDPIDMYSATKGAGTLLCQAYSRKYKLNATVVRPYSVYGPGDRKFKLHHRIWKCFVDSEDSMNLFEGMHDWIYIDDFVAGVDLVLQSKGKPRGEIVNLGTGRMSSNFYIFQLFCKEFGFTPSNIILKQQFMKAADSSVWCADIQKAKYIYNFRPKFTIEDGIKQFIKDEHE